MTRIAPETKLLEMVPARQHVNCLSLLAIFSFGVFAYLQHINRQGWVSDDYAEVFDNGFVPYTNLSNALKLSGAGHYTLARLLGLPVKLYGGYWLGPVASHYLQTILHFICALMFYRLLLLLEFSQTVCVLAAVSFISAPWISEAVIWWATMITPAGTLFVLVGLCLYVKMLAGQLRPTVAMPIICFFILCSLSFYELWLCVPLLFVVVGMYRQLDQTDLTLTPKICWKTFCSSLARAWPIFVAVLFWGIAYQLTVFVSDPRRGHFDPRRIAIVLLSMHARIYWWVTRQSWRTPFLDGLKYARAWWTLLIAGILFLLPILKSTKFKTTNVHRLRRLYLGIFLAWGFYASSKMVFIFQGGVAEHTRHNYGAAMCVGLVIGLLYEHAISNLTTHKILQWFCTLLVLTILSALAVTSAGIRHHYVETSRAERFTISKLLPVASSMNPGETLIVCGSGTTTNGELAYFSDDSGIWLQNWMRKVNPSLTCFVVPAFRTEGNDIIIPVKRGVDLKGELRFTFRQARIFVWTQGQLQELPQPI